MFCSCDAQKFLIVPVLDQKQILACGRVSGLETPANTFVTKKRNFPFLEAAQILVFFPSHKQSFKWLQTEHFLLCF